MCEDRRHRRKVGKIAGIVVICFAGLLVFSGTLVFAQRYPFSGQTITLAVHGEPKSAAIYMIQDDFEKKYGVKLNVVEIAPEALYEKQMIELATGGSAYDVVQFNAFSIADYSVHLEPLKALADKWGLNFHLDDVLPAFEKLYLSWADTWYGVCSDGDVHMLYYRKDIFENPEYKARFYAKYGYELVPPRTWDEYLDVAEFFTGWDWDKSGRKKYGAAEYLKRGRMYWWFLDRFASFGGNYFDDNMNPLINTKPGLKALENMIAAIKYQPPGALNYSYMEIRTAFVKGDVAMAKQWTCVGRAAENPVESNILNKAGYALVPGAYIGGKLNRKSMLAAGYTMAIPKYSRYKDAAVHFLHYFTDVETGLPIVVKDTTVDPYRYSQFEAIDEFKKEYTNWKAVD
ncbi:extracellular solute-binding protein, partial [Candidatus Aerophobetes bacterium]|nr:extracellular solute-binding protein [Candidatus Aerophobetes bacterium]